MWGTFAAVTAGISVTLPALSEQMNGKLPSLKVQSSGCLEQEEAMGDTAQGLWMEIIHMR